MKIWAEIKNIIKMNLRVQNNIETWNKLKKELKRNFKIIKEYNLLSDGGECFMYCEDKFVDNKIFLLETFHYEEKMWIRIRVFIGGGEIESISSRNTIEILEMMSDVVCGGIVGSGLDGYDLQDSMLTDDFSIERFMRLLDIIIKKADYINKKLTERSAYSTL